jgi:hypothetical protein
MTQQTVLDERLKVIGQIEVVRARLDALKKVLINEPIAGTANVENEIGNLSLQMGVLVGAVTIYLWPFAGFENGWLNRGYRFGPLHFRVSRTPYGRVYTFAIDVRP